MRSTVRAATRSVALLGFLAILTLPTGVDANAAYPITLDTRKLTEGDFRQMCSEVAAMNAYAARKLGPVDARALAQGKTLAQTCAYGKFTLERTVGLSFVPFDEFVKQLPPDRWGPNLADYRGGEVRAHGPGRQVERMVLASPGKDLDMTKIEKIDRVCSPDGRIQRVVVTWKVLKSDNGSVIQDIGSVTFSREGPEQTRVAWLSGHRLSIFPDYSSLPGVIRAPLEALQHKVVGAVLSSYFSRATDRYRKLTGGEPPSMADRLREMIGR
ncbi:MAG: hypothetical protein HZA54_08850 [Planctomycetes bacterium]|nr:hypothetical protein [Planctomycetota bacterium]